MYPTEVVITPLTFRNAASTPQKQPAPKVAVLDDSSVPAMLISFTYALHHGHIDSLRPGKGFSHTFIGQRTKFFSMKHLYRSKKDRILGGICAGLGEHLDIDPNIIRLIWAAVTILSFGTGILVYILAWIIIPEQETDDAVLPPQELDESR